MAASPRRTKQPNQALGQLITASGASHKALAHRVNQLAQRAGKKREYTHTSVANWVERGMQPKPPIPSLIAAALGERCGRPVSLAEIGMDSPNVPDATGLDFARDPQDAIRLAADFWSHVDRRALIGTSAFAISAFATPVTRWLVSQADDGVARYDGRRVGRAAVAELWEAAREAQSWDSKYGGGNWKSNQVADCLTHRAAPLLRGQYTEPVGRALFSVTSELSRVAGWSALDIGHHDVAQRHFIQALRLARAGADVQLGSYVLTTMALHALLRGYTSEAIDMAQGAYARGKRAAAPRVLAFTKLIEARAHGKARDPRSAAAALAGSEALLDRARQQSDEPEWIGYFTHARMSADAAEIYRDLHIPQVALQWHSQAAAMSARSFTRSVGLRYAVVGTVHLQNRDLDQGLNLGHQAVDILANVESSRARDYVRDFVTALAPWQGESRVNDFIKHARRELSMSA
ncbi:sporulation protein [Streptomyces sp. JV176]|uniref:sporulation protein n=1 Tax=Streptomyces sp. JV176 TaxID=858630 RepID=UPI002E7A103B|nr:sporulation protein [Streptomyces sp. JV176]MEE1799561.1 sporulation protein [Streptomyces sp. JV176]